MAQIEPLAEEMEDIKKLVRTSVVPGTKVDLPHPTSALEHDLGRSPALEEIATRADMTVEEVHELRATINAVPTVTLSTGEDEGSSLTDDLADL